MPIAVDTYSSYDSFCGPIPNVQNLPESASPPPRWPRCKFVWRQAGQRCQRVKLGPALVESANAHFQADFVRAAFQMPVAIQKWITEPDGRFKNARGDPKIDLGTGRAI